MMVTRLTQAWMTLVSVLSLVALIYVYVFPPPSMQKTRNGVPHFTPKVLNPETGKPLSMDELVRHYRGD